MEIPVIDPVSDDTVSVCASSSAVFAPSFTTKNTSVGTNEESGEESDSDNEFILGRDPEVAQGNHYKAVLADEHCEWMIGHGEDVRNEFVAKLKTLWANPGAWGPTHKGKHGEAQEWQQPFLRAILRDNRIPKTQLHVFELNSEAFKTAYKLNFFPMLVVYWGKESGGLHFELMVEEISQLLLEYPHADEERPEWVATNSSAQAGGSDESERKEPDEPET
jgi:hypothetical protein